MGFLLSDAQDAILNRLVGELWNISTPSNSTATHFSTGAIAEL